MVTWNLPDGVGQSEAKKNKVTKKTNFIYIYYL